MKYLDFDKSFREFPVFSIKDIKKRYPDFDSRRLVEWQQKDYIQKVRRGYYCFRYIKKNELFLYQAANKIYSPSYISLESALSYYSFIPEGVFITSSISTRNTANYDTIIGEFSYKHVKPELFFGYRLIQGSVTMIKIAEPEKVLLDYLYLNKPSSLYEIKEMRFNSIQIRETIDFSKLKIYQKIFNSKVVDARVKLLKRIINA